MWPFPIFPYSMFALFHALPYSTFCPSVALCCNLFRCCKKSIVAGTEPTIFVSSLEFEVFYRCPSCHQFPTGYLNYLLFLIAQTSIMPVPTPCTKGVLVGHCVNIF